MAAGESLESVLSAARAARRAHPAPRRRPGTRRRATSRAPSRTSALARPPARAAARRSSPRTSRRSSSRPTSAARLRERGVAPRRAAARAPAGRDRESRPRPARPPLPAARVLRGARARRSRASPVFDLEADLWSAPARLTRGYTFAPMPEQARPLPRTDRTLPAPRAPGRRRGARGDRAVHDGLDRAHGPAPARGRRRRRATTSRFPTASSRPCQRAGKLSRGAALWMGSALAQGARSVSEAAAPARRPDEAARALRAPALARGARAPRRGDARADPGQPRRARAPPGLASRRTSCPLLYAIVATGNIHEDVVQAEAAARAGAQCIAVIRSTAQSLLDHVPYGATTAGFGGTFATQENFRLMRAALDARRARDRPLRAPRELLLGPLHARDRGDGRARAARHDAERRALRHHLPRHQSAAHADRPELLAPHQRASPASSSTRARTTT